MPAPTAVEVYEVLEGYGVDTSVLSEKWIDNRRDNFVVPWVERKTRQSFSGTVQTVEYYSGRGSSVLTLDRKPIVSIDDVRLVHTGGGNFLIDVTTLVLIASEGIIKVRRNFEESTLVDPIFPRGRRNIQVTYTYGFADFPAPIKEAVAYLTAEAALGNIAARTGGGDLSTINYNRSFGDRGKYTKIRADLARWGHSLLSEYWTVVTGV